MTAFFDTNILVYAFSDDETRRDQAQRVLTSDGIISVQVCNEFANVLRKKQRQPWPLVESALAVVRARFDAIRPITITTHAAAVLLAREHGLGFYDALIVASALEAGCDTLLSEDLQHGRRFGHLAIRNPFL